jgi:hypothetical protein
MPSPDRRIAVKDSMRAIMTVIGERQRYADRVQAKNKFDMVRAKAVEEGRAPAHALDAKARISSQTREEKS